MSRVEPSDVSRRTMLGVALAGAAVILVQPVSAAFADPALAAAGGLSENQAAQKAAGWLSKAALPPGAERAATSPSPLFDVQRTEWWYEPTVVKTAYWTIAGASVAATANWLGAHPTGDLLVPTHPAIPADEDVDLVSLGNVPLQGALEGIAYTIAKTADGVAVRAEIGVVPGSASLRASGDAGGLGSPGQG